MLSGFRYQQKLELPPTLFENATLSFTRHQYQEIETHGSETLLKGLKNDQLPLY